MDLNARVVTNVDRQTNEQMGEQTKNQMPIAGARKVYQYVLTKKKKMLHLGL